MLEFFKKLFDTADFPQRWHCGTWTPGHGWLHITSDLATWAAYTTIPIVLTYFVWRRKDIPFTRLFWLFAIFILACGSVHLVEALIFWQPVYRLSGLLKLVTALVSWLTVIALVQVTPQALKLPGLAATNARLENEIAQRAFAERAAKESEQRARLILESTGEAIYGVDLQGNCTFCNPACLRVLGYDDPEELIGKNAHDLIHHTRSDGTAYPSDECHIYVAFRNQEAVHIDDEVLWRKDGTSFPAEYWSHPIRSQGETVGAVVTFIDITERVRVREELIRARQAAEAASSAKSQILANTSHEIRTPLTAILGYAEILLNESDPENRREHVETIQRNGQTLLELIDDILDLSRIEAGHFECELADCRTSELLGPIVKLMQFRAREKSLPLHFIVDGEVPEIIRTDRKRLRQVLINLLTNAIKFTEHGRVELRVKARRDATPAAIDFCITDTGIGIPPEQEVRLFEPFEQGDPSVNRKYGGSGLGLAICRRLVHALGGNMTLDSEVGVGSQFHVTIPIGIAQPLFVSEMTLEEETDMQTQLDLPKAEEAVSLRGRVLLADDRRDVRHIAKHFLLTAGATVVTAEDGQQAMDAVKQAEDEDRPFDLVIMDMQMPIVDGYAAVAQLRAGGLQVPIIALTADAMRGDREKSLAAGCDEYLSKPIDSETLISLVHQMLQTPIDALASKRNAGGNTDVD